MGASQRLVEVMVGVDETRQRDMAGSVEGQVAGAFGRAAARDAFDDLRPLDDNAALGVRGDNGKRILDPKTHEVKNSDPMRSFPRRSSRPSVSPVSGPPPVSRASATKFGFDASETGPYGGPCAGRR